MGLVGAARALWPGGAAPNARPFSSRPWSRSGRSGSGCILRAHAPALPTIRATPPSPGLGPRRAAQDVLVSADAGVRPIPLALALLLAAAFRPRSRLRHLGALILLLGIARRALADAQLQALPRRSSQQGQVCDAGLWGWSRHPNYFFEWLGWLAYPVIAIAPAASWGWLALLAPVFMYWLLVHVSGIPPLEEQMLRSRGERFATTSARQRVLSAAAAAKGEVDMTRRPRIIGTDERLPLPDTVTSAGVAAALSRTARGWLAGDAAERRRLRARNGGAPHRRTRRGANAQHYEMPAEFFAHMLGPHRKYSCCLYQRPASTLAGGRGACAGRTARMPTSPTGKHPRTRLRLGLAVAVDGASIIRRPQSPPCRTRIRSARSSRARPRRGGLDKSCASSPPT